MKYTTEQVIDLYDKYHIDKLYDLQNKDYTGKDTFKSFRDWLREKEQSQLPVEGQTIWVRDKFSNGGYSGWVEEVFSHFKDNLIFCFITKDRKDTAFWDEYSLTKPE